MNKYGVTLVSLAEKWSKKCWNCSAEIENLKLCAICKISRYCGKTCQKQDWKIHKELHKVQQELVYWENLGVFFKRLFLIKK